MNVAAVDVWQAPTLLHLLDPEYPNILIFNGLRLAPSDCYRIFTFS
jgi:hypothetical protein